MYMILCIRYLLYINVFRDVGIVYIIYRDTEYCIVLVVFGKCFECAHKIKCGRYLFTWGVNFFVVVHKGLHTRKRVNGQHSVWLRTPSPSTYHTYCHNQIYYQSSFCFCLTILPFRNPLSSKGIVRNIIYLYVIACAQLDRGTGIGMVKRDGLKWSI